MTRTGHEFLGRVLRAPLLKQYEIMVFWQRGKRTNARILARHPYGRWASISLFKCGVNDMCQSANGNPRAVHDIPTWLKQKISDKGMNKGTRTKP